MFAIYQNGFKLLTYVLEVFVKENKMQKRTNIKYFEQVMLNNHAIVVSIDGVLDSVFKVK